MNDLKSQHLTDEVKKVEDKVNENKKEIIFVKRFFSYEYHSNLVYDCKLNSFKIYASSSILDWKPKNIYDPSNKNELSSNRNINNFYPNVIYIYCVYKLDPIDFSRNNKFTIQNALFDAIKITKNANTSKYKYKGYGICFHEIFVRNLLMYEKRAILIILRWLET